MRLKELNSKIVSLSLLIFTLIVVVISTNAQNLVTVLPDGIFSPDPEEVEDFRQGIVLYDQYCIHNTVPKIRKESSGIPQDGKIEDFYSNGNLLHKGAYSKGVLKSFTNYYVNGALERKYKGKKPGTGKLECFYLNGYYRSVYVYKDFVLVEKEIYYDNGVLEKQEEWDLETQAPTLVVSKNTEGTLITTVQLIDQDSLIYVKDVTLSTGERLEYGRMILYPGTGDIINDGPYYTYNRTGTQTSKVIYKTGNPDKIVEEKRPERKVSYYSYELPETIASENNSGNSGEKSGELITNSIVPSDLIRFDLNQDDFISNREVDNAVSEFFEDDSITLDQINGLVNFFFEQD